MRKGLLAILIFALVSTIATVRAEKNELKSGKVIEGDISTVASVGVGFRLSPVPEGQSAFTPKIPWAEFTEETLKKLAENPKAKPFVALLIQPTPEQVAAQFEISMPESRKVEIKIGEKPSPGREFAGLSIMSSLFKGSGLIILGLLYGANLFASYEVGMFRNYPGVLVAGIGAVVPFLTPLVWLCMPRRVVVVEEHEEEGEEEMSEAHQEQEAAHAALAAAAAAVAPPVVEAKPIPPTKYFKRGEFNINRRFIETKFAGFFRAIPNDEDRDLSLVIKSARGDFAGRRILKITNTDLTFQVPKGEASVDEVIPLNDVFEIQIRHKDATD